MLRGNFLKNRNAYIAAQEPGIFHCHHYNTYLQAVIEDTKSYLDIYPILIESAQEIVFAQFSHHFKTAQVAEVEERKKAIEDYFSFCGFGKIDLENASPEGGTVETIHDHYGIGWKNKFGLRNSEEKGVSFFTLGYLLGAIEAIYELPNGAMSGEQTSCIAKGDAKSSFHLVRNEANRTLGSSPKEGAIQEGALPELAHTVNYEGIREALINMPLQGAIDSGLIDAFGVLLTRMYANYYCLISYKFLRLFEEKMGSDGIQMAQELLTEAGHVCAFNTFGGIMQSAEWNGLIKPMLHSKDDWVHGITAVVNALGWGFWEIIELEPNQKLTIKIQSGYEPTSYLQGFGKASFPISFLATGGTAGIMNLIYNTSLTDEALTLDQAFYHELRNLPTVFQSKQLKCRAQGDAYDLFEVTRS